MAGFGLNILAQFLKTNREVGYVITDVNKKYDNRVLRELKKFLTQLDLGFYIKIRAVI